MGSQERLWSTFGARWGWPAPTLTIEEDHIDLIRHEREAESHMSFNYCVLDREESRLFGCVYIDPPDANSPPEVDGEVCWWVIDAAVDTQLESRLDTLIPRWIAQAWPFKSPRIGLSWQENVR
jgi:hypothetical protein